MNLEQLEKLRRVYILGAQSRAGTLTGYLRVLYPRVHIAAYLVDDIKENPREIGGIPVIPVEAADFSVDTPVCIATKSAYHKTIIAHLESLGATRILPLTAELDNLLRNAYVKRRFEEEGRSFMKLEELAGVLPDAKKGEALLQQEDFDAQGCCCRQSGYGSDHYAVYMAKSVYGKPLQTGYQPPSYEIPIQVGAALTGERLGECIVTDDRGENISDRNRQYSELTALYWLWKNSTREVVGLCHYRRHFILPPGWQQIMERHKIDAVLPVPTCVLPSIEGNYRQRHDPSDWEFLYRLLQEKYPEYWEVAKRIYQKDLYLPCNMFILRRPLLDRMCSFLFPILEEVWRHGGQKEDVYQNRYPGFVSERLITLFFAKHGNELKTVYADKNFLT